MKYRNGRLLSVDIHLTTLDDSIEFIAHELEHVIEQLDAVDLDAQTRTGTVWKREDGAFETRRAIEIGKRVAREVSLLSATSRPPAMPRPSAWPPFRVVPQQYALASVHDPRSGRVSADGHHVVVASNARLLPPDGNRMRDIYAFDVSTQAVTLETPGAGGRPSNGESFNPDISSDGRYIVFESTAHNLTNVEPGAGGRQIYWRDRQTGVTRLLSTTPAGAPANGISTAPAISGDGGTAVFVSTATNLLGEEGSSGAGIGVYRIDLSSNKRSRVDVTGDGRGHSGQSASPAISGDGRYIAFATDADATTGGAAGRDHLRDKNGVFDIYVSDVLRRQTRRVSVASTGSDSDGPSYQPSISIDGRYVAFVSEASNLTVARHTSHAQVFVRDMETGTIEMVSHTSAGGPGNAPSARPAMAGDGSRIAYQSLASNLLCQKRCRAADFEVNLLWDVYVYDRNARHTMRASADEPEEWMESSRGPSLDEKGTVLTFSSVHQSSPEDEAHDEDLFIVDSSGRREQPTENSRSASHRRRRAPRRRSAYTAAISRSSAVSTVSP